MSDLPLVEAIRAGLRAAAEPERAEGMRAYMKSEMPFLGVRVPQVRRLVRGLPRPRSLTELADAATDLWRRAGYREERYAASALTGLPMARGQLGLLELHTEMIVTGAWWDHVDETAHRIGELLVAHPDELGPRVLSWSTDPDRWLRRTSIICQLGLRQRTDLDLLTSVVAANLDDREFFIRKAIGWALRDLARTDPDWVHRFVEAGRARLSPLSVREALKHIGPSRPREGGRP